MNAGRARYERDADKIVAESTFLRFVFLFKSASGKTDEFAVDSKDGVFLGRIRWYAPWRCYVFYPAHETLFNVECLREVSQFVGVQTREVRKSWRTSG